MKRCTKVLLLSALQGAEQFKHVTVVDSRNGYEYKINDVVLDLNPGSHEGFALVHQIDPVIFIRIGQFDFSKGVTERSLPEPEPLSVALLSAKLKRLDVEDALVMVLNQEDDWAGDIDGYNAEAFQIKIGA